MNVFMLGNFTPSKYLTQNPDHAIDQPEDSKQDYAKG